MNNFQAIYIFYPTFSFIKSTPFQYNNDRTSLNDYAHEFCVSDFKQKMFVSWGHF